MKKEVVIIIAFILLASLLTYRSQIKLEKTSITNGEMLQSEKNASISTQSNVEYFKGASGFFARPQAEGNYPGVVIIHENRGLRPEIRTMAELLAKDGYMVLAVDLLGKVVETQEEARSLTANYKQETGIKNLQSAVAYLKSKGATKIASLGWCFGGGQSLQLALSGQKMDATIIYYGRLVTTPKELAPIKWPVLGIFGGADQSISTESVNQFDQALDEIKVPNEIYIYPGVGHAFANPSGMNYAPEETKAAWEKTTAFLKKYLQD
jgi:carboxymethylenebutenolidase